MNDDKDSITSDMALAVLEEQADETIRRVYHHDRWYFSVLDVIAILTNAPRPSVYWAMVKSRMESESVFCGRCGSPMWPIKSKREEVLFGFACYTCLRAQLDFS